MVSEDPLDSLFVKGDEVNRELLRDVLVQFVRLDERGRIFPLSAFYQQPNKNKVLILLLARKALSLKTGSEESISPSELGKLIDIPDGSLRPLLRLLADEKVVDDENSRYKVFSHAIQRCSELLSSEKEALPNSRPKRRGRSSGTRIGMKGVIEDISRQGGLDEPKTAREIFDMVIQRRPGTVYNALYKVILDLVHEQALSREVKEGVWFYRSAKQ